jgi:hypothetical protein
LFVTGTWPWFLDRCLQPRGFVETDDNHSADGHKTEEILPAASAQKTVAIGDATLSQQGKALISTSSFSGTSFFKFKEVAASFHE